MRTGATVRRQGAGIRWTMRWRKYWRTFPRSPEEGPVSSLRLAAATYSLRPQSKRIGMEWSGPQEAARRAVAPYRDLTISVEYSS